MCLVSASRLLISPLLIKRAFAWYTINLMYCVLLAPCYYLWFIQEQHTLYFQNVFLTVNIPVYWNHVTVMVFASVVLPLPVRFSFLFAVVPSFPCKGHLCAWRGTSAQCKEVQ